MIYSIVVLTIILLVLPYFTGVLLADKEDSGLISYVYGYLVQWALFFCITVFAILNGKKLSFVTFAFLPVSVVLSLTGLFFFVKKIKHCDRKTFVRLSKNELIYLACFIGIVLFQLYKSVFYAYGDGDDSFYIATAQDISQTGLLYLTNAYMGTGTTINFRYALSPLPAWLAMVANLGKIQVTTLSFTIVPVVFISITYIIYNEIAKAIFEKDREKRYLFMMFISVFVMFSNVSTSTAETFLLTRARQGKEGLANIVLPFFFYMLFKMSKTIVRSKTDRFINVRMFVLMVSGCLCGALMSVFGNILSLLVLLIMFVFVVVKRRRFIDALAVSLLTIPNLAVLYIYFTHRSNK